MKLESGLNRSASATSFFRTPIHSTHSTRSLRRGGDLLGLACLIASVLLMSTGVRTVKAGDEDMMSVDPQRVEAERQKVAAEAAVAAKADANAAAPPLAKTANEAGEKRQKAQEKLVPGMPGIEVQPGVIVLNTRGYNYGPPPAAIDPAAMRIEKSAEAGRE